MLSASWSLSFDDWVDVSAREPFVCRTDPHTERQLKTTQVSVTKSSVRTLVQVGNQIDIVCRAIAPATMPNYCTRFRRIGLLIR